MIRDPFQHQREQYERELKRADKFKPIEVKSYEYSSLSIGSGIAPVMCSG